MLDDDVGEVCLIDTGWPELQYVHHFLSEGVFPPDLSPQQKQRLVKKSLPYTILDDSLYKMGKDKMLHRVVPS